MSQVSETENKLAIENRTDANCTCWCLPFRCCSNISTCISKESRSRSVETECDSISYFLLTACTHFPHQTPTEYINQPKLLVIITNIHVKKTARRKKGKTGKYSEGGNIIIRIDGRSTVLFCSVFSTAFLCQYRAQGKMSTPPPQSPWILSNFLSFATEPSSHCHVTLFRDAESALNCPNLS